MSRFFSNVWRTLLVPVLPLAMAGAVRADEVTDWHEHMLVALTKGGGNSQIRSRNAAHVSAAVFDAVNGIERRYTPIHVPAAAPPGASKRAAAVQAAYAILLSKFPAQADELGAKRQTSLAAIADGGGVDGSRCDVGTVCRRRHSPVAEHRWIHTDAASLSGQRRTRQVASDNAGRARRGAAIRHDGSLGDRVA
jgi:hypothetical protein